jgi:hypothetical protein
MDLQKINVKFFVERGAEVPLGDLIPVFHRWIQQDKLEGMLIDVTEYTHVHHGPGLLLIANEANYSLDETDGKRGLLYNQKRTPVKSPEEHLRTAFRRALQACSILEAEEEAQGKMKFAVNHLQVFVNDRLNVPPGAPGREELEKILKPFLHSLFDGAPCVLSPEMDSQKRMGFEVKVDKPLNIQMVLQKLSAN